jgi:hypothetical protein
MVYKQINMVYKQQRNMQYVIIVIIVLSLISWEKYI